MTIAKNIPFKSYGILQQEMSISILDDAVEAVRNLGYATFHSGYTTLELQSISEEFDRTRNQYLEKYGEANLRSVSEFNTVRSLLTQGGDVFLKLALNENLLSIIRKLIPGKFILNQQNGIVNPAGQIYEQSAWHRDLPYQHFVSTKPLAINALFCVDDFTYENGATFVLPASHKSEAFPSMNFIERNAIQIAAKSGSFITASLHLCGRKPG